jgi:hypothetical protein
MEETGSSIVLSLQPPIHCAKNKNYKKTTGQHETAVVGKEQENYKCLRKYTCYTTTGCTS